MSLLFDGQVLGWLGRGLSWKATSGLPGSQLPSEQCTPEAGPTPEGDYRIALLLGSMAMDDGRGQCALAPSWKIEKIPRGVAAEHASRTGRTGVPVECGSSLRRTQLGAHARHRAEASIFTTPRRATATDVSRSRVPSSTNS